ncbi:hypothetical protein [Paenibacillus elgii]|uniref:hypothetical protein n=1 Tax=Paenibacillus elgii TaxID=189691 RepID=UPI000248DD81|nr:hypothetical protein [Paenibacillus elgii]
MNRNWVLVSILIVMFLSAMEATIVTLLAFLIALGLPGISNRELFGDGKGAVAQKKV